METTCAVAPLTQEVSVATINTFAQDEEVGVLTLNSRLVLFQLPQKIKPSPTHVIHLTLSKQI